MSRVRDVFESFRRFFWLLRGGWVVGDSREGGRLLEVVVVGVVRSGVGVGRVVGSIWGVYAFFCG